METRNADVIVLGAGVAGLRAVLALEPLRVALVTKTMLGVGGSSPYAQGGIAAAIDRDDSPRLHADDTLAVGGGLNDPAIVRVLTERAPGEIEHLVGAGTRFDRAPDGSLALGREAGHQRRRIVHAGGDATGWEMVRSLSEAVARQPGVVIRERCFAEELVVEGGRVTGVIVDPGGGRPRLRIDGARGDPRHRRRRPDLSLHHESAGAHRRRPGDGGARRRRAWSISSSCSSIPPRSPPAAIRCRC